MKIDSKDRSISEILTAFFLEIPRYQRPYEWTTSEVEDLWDDITNADSGYFIGSMVMFPISDDTRGLVDGQQRVTTLTLLYCVLRNALRAAGATDEADGLQNLIEKKSVRDNKLHFVLQASEDRPYLRWAQDGAAGKAPNPLVPEKLLALAYLKLEALLETHAPHADAKSRDKLIKLRDRLLGLRLVSVEVDEEDDATIIFQTLNSRGRDLEAADLVKSHLLSILKTRNPTHDVARDKWNSILASLAESSADLRMDNFLLHSWLSRRDYLARNNLGRETRKKVRARSNTRGIVSATAFLDELVLDARLYRVVNEPDFRTGWQQEEAKLRQAIEALRVFKVRQPMPWLLALWRAYDSGDLKQKHAIPALATIERFHFINTAITSLPSSGGVSQMYASHARQLTAALSIEERVSVLADVTAKLTDPTRLATAEQFSAGFVEMRSSRIYTQQKRLVDYVLQRLHANDAPTVPDFKHLTLEHLAPQSTNGTTPGDGDVSRIGNLILIPRDLNDMLANKSFAEKLPLLQNASQNGVLIDPSVLSATEWGVAQIEKRSERMAKLAYEKVWKLPVA